MTNGLPFPITIRKRFIYPIRKVLFWDESGHEPQLRAVHADGATAKSAKMGGKARPSGSGVGLMHRLPLFTIWLVIPKPSARGFLNH